MRALHPAPFSPARFPALRAAWRILAGLVPLAIAPPAGADASLPRLHREAPHTPPLVAQQPKPENSSVHAPPKAPSKKPAKAHERAKQPKEVPPFDGEMGRRVAPARFVLATRESEDVVVLHPHGPDEPCLTANEREGRRS